MTEFCKDCTHNSPNGCVAPENWLCLLGVSKDEGFRSGIRETEESQKAYLKYLRISRRKIRETPFLDKYGTRIFTGQDAFFDFGDRLQDGYIGYRGGSFVFYYDLHYIKLTEFSVKNVEVINDKEYYKTKYKRYYNKCKTHRGKG